MLSTRISARARAPSRHHQQSNELSTPTWQ
jgi:hypothetical protein